MAMPVYTILRQRRITFCIFNPSPAVQLCVYRLLGIKQAATLTEPLRRDYIIWCLGSSFLYTGRALEGTARQVG